MAKRLTEADFKAAIAGLDVGEQTLEIARAVLVDGVPQSRFVQQLRLSRGAISQAVNRVWLAHQAIPPPGSKRVDVLLPAHQAFIVEKWAKEFAEKKGSR